MCSLPCAFLLGSAMSTGTHAFFPSTTLSAQGQRFQSRSSNNLLMAQSTDHERETSGQIHRVVFLRHGESTWNRDDRHIGWTDVPLTEKGEDEALRAGRALRREGFEFDIVFSSMLKRVLKTKNIAMEELDQLWVPEVKDWRLNERHYGDCIGKTKAEAEEAFGKENVALWASSYDVAPRPMSTDGLYYPKDDRRYQHVVDENGECAIPRTECMKDVSRRVVGYWEEEIVPVVRSGKRVLVVGHANMLKTLLQHVDGVPDDVIVRMKVPRATPMVYDLGHDMKSLRSPDPETLLSAEILAIDGAPAGMAAAEGEVNAF
ncbi:unnamed protein product [Scytosiphon promiscuus]